MKNWTRMVGAALFLLPVTASAEEAAPKPAPVLARLVGAWKGKGSMAMGPEKSDIQATWGCKSTSAQFGVVCTFHVTGLKGMPPMEETDLMGFEPNTQTYHWYSVTNMGETHDHVAKSWDHGAAQFVFTGTQEGKPLKEVIDLQLAEDGKHVTGRSVTTVGADTVAVLDLTLAK